MFVNPAASAAALLAAAEPGVHPRAYVYADLGPDLLAFLRAAGQAGAARPLDIRTGPDPVARCVREQPGNTVVVTSRDAGKLDLVAAAVRENLNVLVEPPWVLDPADLPRLEAVLHEAEWREVVVKELTPSRHDPLNELLRDVLADADAFGGAVIGSAADPTLTLEVTRTAPGPEVEAGGDCLAGAAGLVDLAFWLLFPGRAVSPSGVGLLDAVAWPTPVTPQPGVARPWVYGNGRATFAAGGAHARVGVLHEPGGPPAFECVARGERSTVTLRRAAGSPTEFVVTPRDPTTVEAVRAALARVAAEWHADTPGLHFEARRGAFHLVGMDGLDESLPDDGTGNGAVGRALAEYVGQFRSPRSVPPWERSNLVAKYQITTEAAHAARRRRDAARPAG
jgi:hypothetical protein